MELVLRKRLKQIKSNGHNMIIHSINNLSNTFIVKLMEDEFSKSTGPTKINYHPDYKDTPGNIFKILAEDRYKIGNYYVIENNGQLVASSGWNQYDPTLALILTRSYVNKQYRGQFLIGKEILPLILDQVKNYKKVWITVNEYNKIIYRWFERNHSNKKATLFNDWPEVYKNFTPIGLKRIYDTDQYVVELKNVDNI